MSMTSSNINSPTNGISKRGEDDSENGHGPVWLQREHNIPNVRIPERTGFLPSTILPRRSSISKKRVSFKSDEHLVEIRPITPQDTNRQSLSTPTFAELAPCHPRQIEQAMERARVTDFLQSIGCRPITDVHYRNRFPITPFSNGIHPFLNNGSHTSLRGRFNWTPEIRPLSRSSSVRFASLRGTMAQTVGPASQRPYTATPLRLSIATCRKTPSTHNEKLDATKNSPLMTIRRLTSANNEPPNKGPISLGRSQTATTNGTPFVDRTTALKTL